MRQAKLTDSAQRAQILKAAESAFAKTGYHKTSMGAIAKACGISAPHLYNFFSGKTEIALELALHIGRTVSAKVRRLTAKVDGSIDQKIASFLIYDLRETFRVLEQSPMLLDFFSIIIDKHPEIANTFLMTNREMLVEILQNGIAAGELTLSDPQFTAECIQAATIKYRYPQWTSGLSLRDLETELEGLIGILLHGLLR